MSHQTTVTAKTTDLPVTLAEAKEHLRLLSDDLDVNVQATLDAAVAVVEKDCARSLRVSHSLTQSYRAWPCGVVKFDREPVISIASVKYYDADDVDTTVGSSNYRLVGSTEAAAYLEFDDDFTFPALSDRADAVRIAFTVGYSDLDDVPPEAKHAVKLKLGELFGDLDDRMSKDNRIAYESLIAGLHWGAYR